MKRYMVIAVFVLLSAVWLSSMQGVSLAQPAPAILDEALATGVDEATGEPLGITDALAPDTPQIYVVFNATGPAGTVFNVRWAYFNLDTLEDEELHSDTTTLESDFDEQNPRPSWFWLEPPAEGWRLGEYTVTLSINDEEVVTLPFDVIENLAPPAQEPPPRPERPIFGPADGSIMHIDDGFIDEFLTRIRVADFDVEARFFNPYPVEEGNWDYGFLFRDTTGNEFQMVILDSDGFWTHRVRQNEQDEDLAFNVSEAIDTSADGSNLVRLVAWGDTGWLYINGELISTLDLSRLTESGNLSVITGFFDGYLIDGEITRFEGLTVWRLPSPGQEQTPTATPEPGLSPTPTPAPDTPTPVPSPSPPEATPTPELPTPTPAPAEIVIPEGQQNLSLLPWVRPLSSDSPSFDAPKGIDGIPGTSWYTDNNDSEPSYTINLPQEVTVHSLQMLPHSLPGYNFLSGQFQIFNAAGNELFNSEEVTLENGYINLAVDPPVDGAITAVFTAATWDSSQPGFGEFAIVGTVPEQTPQTPPSEIEIPQGQQNLSLLPGVRAVSSSDYGFGYDAAFGIDDDPGTSWYTAIYDPEPLYTIHLPEDVTVHSLHVLPASAVGYNFLTGRFQVLDAAGDELFNSETAISASGYINLDMDTPVSGARSVVFTALTWESIEPGLGEFAVVGTVP